VYTPAHAPLHLSSDSRGSSGNQPAASCAEVQQALIQQVLLHTQQQQQKRQGAVHSWLALCSSAHLMAQGQHRPGQAARTPHLGKAVCVWQQLQQLQQVQGERTQQQQQQQQQEGQLGKGVSL